MPGSWAGRSIKARPVLWAWLLVAAFLALCWCAGISPNSDPDDILKLMQIRAYLETGSWFDRIDPRRAAARTLRVALAAPSGPALCAAAWLLAPFAGRSAALAWPPLRCRCCCSCQPRVVSQDHGWAGFRAAASGLLPRLVPARAPLFEFAPGRIDYHNVQIVLLLAVIALTLMRSAGAAMASGAIVALALATSTEFALFFALSWRSTQSSSSRLMKRAARGWERSAPRLRVDGIACLRDHRRARQLRPGRLRQLFATASAGAGSCRRVVRRRRRHRTQGHVRLSFVRWPSRFRASLPLLSWWCCFRNAWPAPMPASTPMCAMSFSATSGRSRASLRDRISCSRQHGRCDRPVHRRHRAGCHRDCRPVPRPQSADRGAVCAARAGASRSSTSAIFAMCRYWPRRA